MSVIMDFIMLLYSLPRNHSAIFDVKATIIYASINLAKQIDDPSSCEVESLLLMRKYPFLSIFTRICILDLLFYLNFVDPNYSIAFEVRNAFKCIYTGKL